jgi:hypothetical protein
MINVGDTFKEVKSPKGTWEVIYKKGNQYTLECVEFVYPYVRHSNTFLLTHYRKVIL